MSLITLYLTEEKLKYGGYAPVAKNLHRAATTLKRQIKTNNPINTKSTQSLNQIKKSVRGVPGVPKSIKSNVPKVLRSLRDSVRKDVIAFVNLLNRGISSIHGEFRKLESQFQRQCNRAKGGKVWFKIDPTIPRKFKALDRKLINFKVKWNKRLNRLASNGDRSVQSAINTMKNQIDQMHNCIRSNINYLNRMSKMKKKKGAKQQSLITKPQATSWNNKWLKAEKQLEKFRLHTDRLFEQLKATKKF